MRTVGVLTLENTRESCLSRLYRKASRKQAAASDHIGLNASLPATCFPTAASMANSWNEELGQQLGTALGEEAAAQNVHVLLGPGVNIKRNPLCGRKYDGF